MPFFFMHGDAVLRVSWDHNNSRVQSPPVWYSPRAQFLALLRAAISTTHRYGSSLQSRMKGSTEIEDLA
jgi:hypothetical protein